MTIVHETITLERHYDATPERVFRAFADPEAKAMWFPSAPAHWIAHSESTFEFREGGLEASATGPAGGEPYHYTARYHDIVPDQRIIFSYEMTYAGQRISVSIQSIDLYPEDSGTRLVLTDQGAYLDGRDTAQQRRGGIEPQLDQLAKALAGDMERKS
jgi:uncharacterized protein YndB with AHSA1/START domain